MRHITNRLLDITKTAIKRIVLQRKIDVLTAIGDLTGLLDRIEKGCEIAADKGLYSVTFKLKKMGNFKAVIKKYDQYSVMATLKDILRDEVDTNVDFDSEEKTMNFTWGFDF